MKLEKASSSEFICVQDLSASFGVLLNFTTKSQLNLFCTDLQERQHTRIRFKDIVLDPAFFIIVVDLKFISF